MSTIQSKLPHNGLLFLGTAGTRFNVINQTRCSGGILASIDGVRIAIDPGPGALVRLCALRPLVDPNEIDAMLLTHRHIDHSGDFNILAEAMTGGGRKPGGTVAMPSDAIDDEPVLYRYLQSRIEHIVRWRSGETTSIAGADVTPIRLRHHGVECYGLRFEGSTFPSWGLISDTAYLSELEDFFGDCRFVVANTTLLEKVGHIDHLSVPDIARFLKRASPRLLVMTHFGTRILEGSTKRIAEALTTPSTKVVAATDGMVIDLNGLI